jgi:hypothetical protein
MAEEVSIRRTDVLAVIPILTSYTIWIKTVCPPNYDRERFITALDGIVAKLSALTKCREERVTARYLPFTPEEITLMSGGMVYYTMEVVFRLPDECDQQLAYHICDQMRAFLRDGYSTPAPLSTSR